MFVFGVNDFRKIFYTRVHVWHHLKIKSNWKYNSIWPKKSLSTHKIISVPILPLNAFRNYSLLTHSSHTRTNLILAPTHAPTSTPHTIRWQALATQPSQGQPRSCRPYRCSFCPDHVAPSRLHPSTSSFAPRSHPSTSSFALRSHPSTSEIASTQPHCHASPLHISDPPPPSPPPPSSKLPSSMSSDPHPSYPSTYTTQSPFRQTHTHLAQSTPTQSSCRRPLLVPISLFPDLTAAILCWYQSISHSFFLLSPSILCTYCE